MLERTDRERLTKNGFIKAVMRGWHIPSSQDDKQGNSTACYTSFGGFCGAYLDERLGKIWCLSPEQSIQMRTLLSMVTDASEVLSVLLDGGHVTSAGRLAGYRTGPVYIRKSKHTPPSKAAIRDMMPALFDLLIEEENPAVRVVLGHFIFVYIHPYFDGNGRTGRFIMNLMMAAGGYSWTIVPVDRRDEYMQALESASVEQNIAPFAKFISSLL